MSNARNIARLLPNASGQLSRTNLQATAQSQMQVFVSNGTFVVPEGVTRLTVSMCGGGGGGGGARTSSTNHGAGGGGGAGFHLRANVNVTPGESIPVVIGAAGAGGLTQSYGSAGGTSTFGTYLTATGGGGGQWDTAALNGGSPSGNNGEGPEYSSDDHCNGGTGGGTPFGEGGKGKSWDWAGGGPNGNAATGYGAGGAGGGRWGGAGGSGYGGNGAPGLCIVEW